ncbi:Rne/Rng family ribonuclease [Parafrankia sp. BMG5.11]|uniref:Rne/Rng family ribonuclease n=1 Tax=Parafrankia sp. BMG5.11 TaxID=222540 RepID=UPI00103D7178|nr:Rne/Rng family ribonuclease [Parafrankia sp. BMG5.11]TCJ36096.1 Rne/Rng family ribonuclease [Parafrankia sp. BMG5.11]
MPEDQIIEDQATRSEVTPSETVPSDNTLADTAAPAAAAPESVTPATAVAESAAPESVTAETAPQRPTRRRRAAGRPAGPPPEEAGPPAAAAGGETAVDAADSATGAGAGAASSTLPVSDGAAPDAAVPLVEAGAEPAPEAAPAKPARRARTTRPRRASREVSEAVPDTTATPAPSDTTSPAAGSPDTTSLDTRTPETTSSATAAPEAGADNVPGSPGQVAKGDVTASDALVDTTASGEAAPAVTKPRRTRARRAATKVEPAAEQTPAASAPATAAAPDSAADAATPPAPEPAIDETVDPLAEPVDELSANATPDVDAGTSAAGTGAAATDAPGAQPAVASSPEPVIAATVAERAAVTGAGTTGATPAAGPEAVAGTETAPGPEAVGAPEPPRAERTSRRRTRAVAPTWTSGAEAPAPAPVTRQSARRPVAMITFQQPEPAVVEPWPRRRRDADDAPAEPVVTGRGGLTGAGLDDVASADEIVDAADDAVAYDTAEFGEALETESSEQAFDGGEYSSTDADGDDAGPGGTRRRRRGRRGRGRARGEEEISETSDLAEEQVDEAEEHDDREPEAEPVEREPRSSRRRSRRSPTRETFDEAEEIDSEAELVAGADSGADADTDAESDADDGADLEDGADDSAEDGSDDDRAGGSRRRRRRRRRSGTGAETAPIPDDPPNTVVHVRETRRDDDLVRGVSGSTRLEAKRQRRREGRDSGRRRAPIVTEAEFLARRESVERRMIVRHNGDRTQIAVLEDGVLVEHFVTRASSASYAGNVYLGRVQNVLASMEAAFVDIGKGRNAVLYAGEVNYDASGLDGRPRKIEQVLKSGQSVLVQVSKDPIGHKGARLTSQVSLPGRYLVYVPDGQNAGISRKLPDTERARLKSILKKITPENGGVIVRTAAEGASEAELERDIERLVAQWEDIQRKAQKASAPSLLYGEPDLVVRVIRDIFNEDFTELVVQGSHEAATVEGYVDTVAPDLRDRVRRYVGTGDVFAEYRVDEQLAKALDRKVWLPSGGSLVIDRTEAMTVIDVNTGKFTGKGGNLEETVTKNNLEAAEEIVRQLRLRDIGGIIVIDFIDMVLESNRELVLRRLTECLGRDRTRHQVAEVTSLGLVQMTRKRVGQGLLEAYSEPCAHCNGRGVLVHLDSAHSRDAQSRDGAQPREAAASSASQPAAEAPAQAAGTSTGRRARHATKPAGPALVAAAVSSAVDGAHISSDDAIGSVNGSASAESTDSSGSVGSAGVSGSAEAVAPGEHPATQAGASLPDAVAPRAARIAVTVGAGSDQGTESNGVDSSGVSGGPGANGAGSGGAEGTTVDGESRPGSGGIPVFANTDDPDSVLHSGTNGAGTPAGAEKPARARRRRASRPVSKPTDTAQPIPVPSEATST